MTKIRGSWVALIVFIVAAGIIGCGGRGTGAVLTGGASSTTGTSTSTGGATSTSTSTSGGTTATTGGSTSSGSTTSTGSTTGSTTTGGTNGSTSSGTNGSTTGGTNGSTTGGTTGSTTGGTNGGTTGSLSAPFDMVFVSDRNGSLDIYAMEDDGGNVTPVVVRILWQDFDPCLSPDGLKVVFVAEVGGDSQIWVWDSATNTELKLTDSAGAKATPVFSPDGTKIVFTNTTENEIYLMNADGSNLTKLTNTPAKEDRDPIFSKDGTRIIFASQQGVQLTPTFGIYSMNLDGSDIQKIVDEITNEVQPWLSTDGSKLLYRENNNITIANADGTNAKKLTTKGNCTRPTFTRNGTRIIYTVNDGGESLFSMDLDGGDNKKISGIGSNSSARGRP